MDEYPFLRELRSPLTPDQLQPLDPRCRSLQFREPLSGAELRRVAAFLDGYPAVTLRIYGHQTYTTLDFLEHLGAARRLQIEIFLLQDLSGLRFLRSDLEALGLGATKMRFSLRPLERFTALRDLWLEGYAKDFEVVGQLVALRRLSLRSITLPDLSTLRTLRELEQLELKLGGTRNLQHLPDIGRLRYFEAWLVRGLTDLGPVAGLSSLRFLFLQALKQVTSLPSLAPLAELRRVHLETLKGLHDLAPIAAAPSLEELLAIDMRHLEPDAFRVFVGHPTLRGATIGLGSDRKNAAVRKLLPLPNGGSQMVGEVFAPPAPAT
ncbi:MAG: hypothetical protein DMD54_16665 [Gemmatimonadetes bacterium]|nr:MAG: hypothetical protein DMD54_16665 [Gemmatimonadota bacterium]